MVVVVEYCCLFQHPSPTDTNTTLIFGWVYFSFLFGFAGRRRRRHHGHGFGVKLLNPGTALRSNSSSFLFGRSSFRRRTMRRHSGSICSSRRSGRRRCPSVNQARSGRPEGDSASRGQGRQSIALAVALEQEHSSQPSQRDAQGELHDAVFQIAFNAWGQAPVLLRRLWRRSMAGSMGVARSGGFDRIRRHGGNGI